MRKRNEEIIREVFGKGCRWIGWKPWISKSEVFKHIMKKVREGQQVGNLRDMYLKIGLENWSPRSMLKAEIDKDTGHMKSLRIPCHDSDDVLIVTENLCTYKKEGGWEITIGDVFEDPLKPTTDELDLFRVLYGDEQVLIDINQEFYATILKTDKALHRKDLHLYYSE